MSTLKVSTIRSNTASTPPTFADTNGVEAGQLCRAWVRFNGNGTVAITDDFNCSSITDNNTGDYTFNFDVAMPNVNYTPVGSVSTTGASFGAACFFATTSTGARVAPTTTAFKINTTTFAASIDPQDVFVAVFGD